MLNKQHLLYLSLVGSLVNSAYGTNDLTALQVLGAGGLGISAIAAASFIPSEIRSMYDDIQNGKKEQPELEDDLLTVAKLTGGAALAIVVGLALNKGMGAVEGGIVGKVSGTALPVAALHLVLKYLCDNPKLRLREVAAGSLLTGLVLETLACGDLAYRFNFRSK